MQFSQLGLKSQIVGVLKHKEALSAQEKIIPLALQGKNIVFTSKTGSGKTLAYTLGFLGKINTRQGLQMLIIVPTRELCIQVGKEIKTVADPLNINVGMLYGGRDIVGDYRTLTKKNQILVATPGRLIDHINEKRLKVGEVKCLVYDESDQMFDQGFFKDCAYVTKRVSNIAQIILASATITSKVEEFIESFEHDYIQVGSLISQHIMQEKREVSIKEKNDLLKEILTKKKFKRAIIFCNTKKKTYDVAQLIDARPLNGDIAQKDRLNTLNLFKEGKLKVLVTTDVAARGIHVDNIDLVVNYDVPTKPEFYVHRIGRTGRVNTKGHAITFVCKEDQERFELIEQQYELALTSRVTHT